MVDLYLNEVITIDSLYGTIIMNKLFGFLVFLMLTLKSALFSKILS